MLKINCKLTICPSLVFYSAAARLIPLNLGVRALAAPALLPLANPVLAPITIPAAARLAALRARIAAVVSFISKTLILI